MPAANNMAIGLLDIGAMNVFNISNSFRRIEKLPGN